MPIIRRQDIDPDLRKKYDGAYRTELRKALLSPSLTAEQRDRIKTELAVIGQPKIYDADRPPPPGAISLS